MEDLIIWEQQIEGFSRVHGVGAQSLPDLLMTAFFGSRQPRREPGGFGCPMAQRRAGGDNAVWRMIPLSFGLDNEIKKTEKLFIFNGLALALLSKTV